MAAQSRHASQQNCSADDLTTSMSRFDQVDRSGSKRYYLMLRLSSDLNSADKMFIDERKLQPFGSKMQNANAAYSAYEALLAYCLPAPPIIIKADIVISQKV